MHRALRWFSGVGLVALLAACGSAPTDEQHGSGSTGTGSTTTGVGGSGSTTTSTTTTTTSTSTTTSSGNGGAGGMGAGGGSTTTTTTTGAGGAGAGGGSTTSGTGGNGGATGSGGMAGTGGGATGSGGVGGGIVGGCAVDADCDDGLYCNGTEVCVAGVCEAGSAPSCDDGISCTTDACDEGSGSCTHTESDAACDNGNYCDGVEVCDPANGDPATGCAPSSGDPCDDGVTCTIDACDEATDACTHLESNALCDDGKQCDGVETCTMLGCSSGTPLDCNDGFSCTSDFCDDQTDACAHVPEDPKCDDGQFCNGAEQCDPQNGAPGTGCAAGTPPDCSDGVGCTVDACDDGLGQCTHTTNDAACNDGSFCNGAETCVAGVGCQAGAPVDCNDGLSCTSDSCSDATSSCVHSPNDAACDDGKVCDGVETCNPNGVGPTGCQAGAPVACASDGISCTIDACDEATGTCQHTVSNAACPQGQFCVLQQGGCTTGTPCSNDAECQDGDLCNGVESCQAGICQPGTAVDCNDGVTCTVDSCNPNTGTCGHAPSDALCNDGLVCNGVETCDAQQGCVAGAPMNCDDGVACTLDQCQEPNGTCAHYTQDFACSDGNLCNGAEVCTLQGCTAGAPYTCPSDGVACTSEVCDPQTNSCKSVPNDDLCGCGETCNPQSGCGNFCQVATCQGKVYACGDCLDNDGDCKIDSADSQCLGPCDNTEASFYGGISGQNNSPCKADCYFDQDTGAGNDDCYWSHKCDPLEVAPAYPPEGDKCAYNPNASIAGYSGTCADAFSSQSATCASYCGPLTPNGCDCFGCCAIPGAPTTVYLGSEINGSGSCTIADLNDPSKCKPCTQVAACLNTCDHCEICVGKPDLPADCQTQTCPNGAQPCGEAGQAACPVGSSCITGCCQANPQ